MSFFNPIAFIGFLAIPAIVLMYMLKRKYKSVEIPSIQLWKQAVVQFESQNIFYKYRNNLLMILQIIAATILVLAMSKPYIVSPDGVQNYIFAIDCSMSMQATDESPSRFEYAKKQIDRLIDSAKPYSKISIVAVNNNPYIAINATENRYSAKKALKEIQISDSIADMDSAFSILKMLNQNNYSNVYIFSDRYYSFEDLDIESVIVGNSSSNTAITWMSHEKNDNVSVLVKLKNYSDKSVEQNVLLYTDGILYDSKNIGLKANEQKDVVFENLPLDSVNLEASIESKDVLIADDRYFDTIDSIGDRKVLLATESNLFLDKSLSILNLNLYKTENIENLNGYDLYVFDGMIPDTMPDDGNIILINPPQNNNFIEIGESLDVNSMSIEDRTLLKFISDIDFSVSSTNRIEQPEWAKTIIDSNVAPLLMYGELKSQKIAVFNFDLHNSDLPLKKEFPIFMYNLINWFMPENITGKSHIQAGDTVSLNLKPDTLSAKVITPDNKIVELDNSFSDISFSDTSKAGIYRVEQKSDDSVYYSSFAVNVIPDESNLLTDKVYSSNPDIKSVQSNMNISNLLIVLLLIVLVFECHVYKNRNFKFKKNLLIVLRTTLVLLLVLSMFNPNISKSTDTSTTVFAVDISDSINSKYQDAVEFIDRAVKTKSKNDFVGVVEFGKYASISNGISEKEYETQLNLNIDTENTDIEQALKLSSVLMLENSLKNIVLISDGQQNIGDILQQSKILKQQGIELNIYPIKPDIDSEVQITELSVPDYASIGAQLDIGVQIDSVSKNQLLLKIYKNNSIILEKDISVQSGQNRFVFSDIADTNGSNVYKAEIESKDDNFKRNNISYGYNYVEDLPNILVLQKDNSGTEIESILKSSNIDVTLKDSMYAPTSIEKLSNYSAVVIADVDMDSLPDGFDKLLENYVKSIGGGVFTTGGINSYALGGYMDTDLEKILPVEMKLTDKSQNGNLGMIIVTDRSGSMGDSQYGISNLSLAKEAVIRALNSMDNSDSIGVIAFDNSPIWINRLEKIDGNRQSIQHNISGINLGGGTSIIPALKLACDTLSDADTKLKHIILLTDGQAETYGYDSIISKMNSENITLSTVAVGQYSDTTLLKKLAESGNGRYYYSTIFTDLPEIFAKETVLAGKEYINDKSFYPILADNSAISDDIESLPQLHGYISATSKPRADNIVVSDTNEPILSTWQYGLGKTAALTTDMEGKWSSDWIKSQSGIDIFKNTVSWILKQNSSKNLYIDKIVEKGKAKIYVSPNSDSDIEYIKVAVVNPNLESFEIEFSKSQPNLYEAEFDSEITGVYSLNVEVKYQDGNSEFANLHLNLNYSEEYDIRNFYSEKNLLEISSEITGGRILNSPDEVFNMDRDRVRSKKNITPYILSIALILFLFEISVKRFESISKRLELTSNSIRLILNIRADNKQKVKTNLNESLKTHKSKKHIEEKSTSSSFKTSSILAENKKKRTGR